MLLFLHSTYRLLKFWRNCTVLHLLYLSTLKTPTFIFQIILRSAIKIVSMDQRSTATLDCNDIKACLFKICDLNLFDLWVVLWIALRHILSLLTSAYFVSLRNRDPFGFLNFSENFGHSENTGTWHLVMQCFLFFLIPRTISSDNVLYTFAAISFHLPTHV